MKKFRKLIPALALLIVSAVLMSTASYAWFSMNTQVTATGMQVTAKSNNTFLLIGTGDNDTADEIQSANPNMTVALTVVDSSAYVYPSKPVDSSDVASVISSATAITAATADNPERWYTAASNDPAHSTTNSSGSTVTSAKVLSSGNFGEYVIAKTVYLTVADGSDPAHNLSVTLTDYSNGLPMVSSGATTNDAVRVLVVSGDNMVTLSGATAGTKQSLYGTTDQTIRDNDVVRVDIYIYYDGSVESVYTNNATNLSGAKFELTFDVDVGIGA